MPRYDKEWLDSLLQKKGYAVGEQPIVNRRALAVEMCKAVGVNPQKVVKPDLFQNLPEPMEEHRFAPPRRWRFDYAWPDKKVALEVEGAVWTQGRHTRGSGFLKDMEKYNCAVLLGWRVIRCTPQTLRSVETRQMLAQLLDLQL